MKELKDFELNVKIIRDGGQIRQEMRMSGHRNCTEMIMLFSEIIPELMQNNEIAILMLCTALAEKIKPSEMGIGERTDTDLSLLDKLLKGGAE